MQGMQDDNRRDNGNLRKFGSGGPDGRTLLGTLRTATSV